MRPENLTLALDALRQAGSVYGILLVREKELLYHDSPYLEAQAIELVSTLDDIAYYFDQEKRAPDQLSFGYDGGNLLILLLGPFRMIVFHHQFEEVDAVARSARAFLKDHAMGLLVAGIVAGQPL